MKGLHLEKSEVSSGRAEEEIQPKKEEQNSDSETKTKTNQLPSYPSNSLQSERIRQAICRLGFPHPF